jgi:hypothetical protein
MPAKKRSVSAVARRFVAQRPKGQSRKEVRVWKIFEVAQKETKAKRMEQRDAEVIGAEILNLRLKSAARH